MAEDDESKGATGASWRRVRIGLAICVALLIIFHRPILLAIARQVALRYASKENLKIDFRLEGNPFSYLTIRNLHARRPGHQRSSPSTWIRSSRLQLAGFTRHGISHLLQNVEVRGAQVVLIRHQPPPHKPRPKQNTNSARRVSRADSIGRCDAHY